MYAVQCEGYKANGDRCRYHGMADVREGMYCHHHERQSQYRSYQTDCRCVNCTSRTTYYFQEARVQFYCQTHKHMAPRFASSSEEESEEEEEVVPTYSVDTYHRTGGPYEYSEYRGREGADRYMAEQLGSGGGGRRSGGSSAVDTYRGGAELERFNRLHLFEEEDDGRSVYIHNDGPMQVNVHHHHHHECQRRHRNDDCTIQ